VCNNQVFSPFVSSLAPHTIHTTHTTSWAHSTHIGCTVHPSPSISVPAPNLIGHYTQRRVHACGQAVGCGVCDTPELWRDAVGLCAHVRAFAGAAESYIHTHCGEWSPRMPIASSSQSARTTSISEMIYFPSFVEILKSYNFAITETEKHSPNTGARANNTLHTELDYPIKEPARQSACEARP